MMWLRLEEVAQHLELTMHGGLVPSVALIAIDVHVEVRQARDQALQALNIHKSIMPGHDDERGFGPGSDDIDIVPYQAVVEPLRGRPRIRPTLVLIVHIGGSVIDVAFHDDEGL